MQTATEPVTARCRHVGCSFYPAHSSVSSFMEVEKKIEMNDIEVPERKRTANW